MIASHEVFTSGSGTRAASSPTPTSSRTSIGILGVPPRQAEVPSSHRPYVPSTTVQLVVASGQRRTSSECGERR